MFVVAAYALSSGEYEVQWYDAGAAFSLCRKQAVCARTLGESLATKLGADAASQPLVLFAHAGLIR